MIPAFILHKQTCHFDLTQNLNECEKKFEYREKNLIFYNQNNTFILKSLPNSKTKKSEF